MGASYAQMLTRNGFAADVQAVQESWKQGMKSAIDAISPELFEATTLLGTPAGIVAKLDQWVTAGVDEPLVSMPAGTVEEAEAQSGSLMNALQGEIFLPLKKSDAEKLVWLIFLE